MKSLYTIQGKVQQGHKRGKRLGFPTMNFPLEQAIPEGVYTSNVTIENKKYNSLTFIGNAKTFNETTFQCETYVFDFNKDVYGKNIIIELVKKLRDNKKFKSEEELIEQMQTDKKRAEEFFSKNI